VILALQYNATPEEPTCVGPGSYVRSHSIDRSIYPWQHVKKSFDQPFSGIWWACSSNIRMTGFGKETRKEMFMPSEKLGCRRPLKKRRKGIKVANIFGAWSRAPGTSSIRDEECAWSTLGAETGLSEDLL
jgi:hypothetical protein